RAERRLKKLGFFKTVKISTTPGTTPDRVVINVECEDQQTGNLAFSGGYSTVDGIVGQISVSEANLFGRGAQGQISATLGHYRRAFNSSYTEPSVFGTSASAGGEVYFRQGIANSYQSYGSLAYGGSVNTTLPITDELAQQFRYSLFNQSITIGSDLNDCSA